MQYDTVKKILNQELTPMQAAYSVKRSERTIRSLSRRMIMVNDMRAKYLGRD
jgi:hypothetical protein